MKSKRVTVLFSQKQLEKIDAERGSESLYSFIKKKVLSSIKSESLSSKWNLSSQKEAILSSRKEDLSSKRENLSSIIIGEEPPLITFCKSCHKKQKFIKKGEGEDVDYQCTVCGEWGSEMATWM